MLILLNKQLVMTETLELSRMKIAGVLRIPVEAVHARWEQNSMGKIVPNFAVEFPDTPDVKDQHVRDVISTVYRQMKGELKDRLAGLELRRI